MIALLCRLFRWLICLYPRKFRADFGEELVDVFEQAIHDAARRGTYPALAVGLREIVDLPANVLLEHVHQKRKIMKHASQNEIQMARWIARISSLVLTTLFAFVILLTDQPILFTVTIVGMSVALMLAWRWERMGGLLTLSFALICAVLGGLSAAIEFDNMGIPVRVLWALSSMVVVFIAWVSPYALVGWLFVSIARYSTPASHYRPIQSDLSSTAYKDRIA